MDSAQDVPKNRIKAVRQPPPQRLSDRPAYQWPHRPAPAVNFPLEKPYNVIAGEGLCELRDNYNSIAPDTKAVNVKRRTSRFGLASLFSRSRAPDLERKQERLCIALEADEDPERLQPGECATSQPTGPSHVSKEFEALPPMESPDTHIRHRTSKPYLKAKPSFKKDISIKTWDPPPLFQAYPQAVKYATLRAPSLSAESIIRIHANRNHSAKPRSDSHTPEPYSSGDSKEKWLKGHKAADSLSKGDWTCKTFVLVTSGYLLQYAGDGSFDRSPEKIMPLTKESAAFASDAIPGQPYVLQVSQVSDDQGTLDKDASRSMLKKLGLRNEMRRSTSTFLLVLNSPEELTNWLVAVRREIQAIGGKEYNPDEYSKTTTEEPIPQLQQKPSQRYLIKRDPNRFSEKAPNAPSHHGRTNTWQLAQLPQADTEASALVALKRQSSATLRSVESRSASNTTASINNIYLDRLRESPRQSYASTAAYTTSTSRGSSPKHSSDKVISGARSISCEFAEKRPTLSTHLGPVYGSKYEAPCSSASHQMPVRTPSPRASQRRTSSPTAPNGARPIIQRRSTSPTLSSMTLDKQTPPATHYHDPPDMPIVVEEGGMTGKRNSTIGELQHLRNLSPICAKRTFPAEKDILSTPPHSSGHCKPPSSESEKRFSRRLSSLEYSRGVFPLQLTRQSPSPHPPPRAALPPLPRAASPYRASLVPPPTAALPTIPSASKLPARYSILPPPIALASTVPVSEPSSSLIESSPPVPFVPVFATHEQAWNLPSAVQTASNVQPVSRDKATNRPSLAHGPGQSAAKANYADNRKSCHPVNLEERGDAMADPPPLPSPQVGVKTAFEVEGLTPLSDESPPNLTREPSPLPPQRDQPQGCRSISRVGREPPPVYTHVASPRSRISVSWRADNYFDGAAPHPFIPPIRVSERKFRGSLDGPWNPSYGAPQRMFTDLRVS